MIQCDCCERRTGLSIDPCQCDPCFCHEYLLCSQHCQCLGSNPLFLVDDEYQELWESLAPRGLTFDEDEYPDADQPQVITG